MGAHKRRRAALAGAVVVAATVVVFAASAVAGSNVVKGNFSSVVVSGPDCPSPVGLCTQGELTGGLKGTFFFSASALIPTADTPSTGVLLYTGDITIEAKGGTLTCKDAGAFRTTGDGAVSSVCAVVAGTGDYAGAGGTVQYVGNFSAETGGVGDYRAAISSP